MSMVEELGTHHFAQRFAGSYFRGPDDAMMMVDTGNRPIGRGMDIPVLRIGGRVERTNSVAEHLSHTFFSNMSMLAVPRLGWRVAQRGRVLVHLSRNNTSYQRGVCRGNIERAYAPHTQYLMRSGDISSDYYFRPVTLGKMVLDPQYISIAQGIQEMNDGKRIAFALTPELAIVPHDEESYALITDSGIVGKIHAESGQIEMSIPFNSENLEAM